MYFLLINIIPEKLMVKLIDYEWIYIDRYDFELWFA